MKELHSLTRNVFDFRQDIYRFFVSEIVLIARFHCFRFALSFTGLGQYFPFLGTRRLI